MEKLDSIDLRMKLTDNQFASPDERARYIFNILRKYAPQATQWDLVCFAAEFLGMQAPALPALHDHAKALLKLVYMMHYQYGEGIEKDGSIASPRPSGGSPDSERAEQENSDRTIPPGEPTDRSDPHA